MDHHLRRLIPESGQAGFVASSDAATSTAQRDRGFVGFSAGSPLARNFHCRWWSLQLEKGTMTRTQDPGDKRGSSIPSLAPELRQACLDEAWNRYQKRDFEISERLSRTLVAADLGSTQYRTLLAASLF